MTARRAMRGPGIALGLLGCLLAAACGTKNLLEALDPSIELLEYQKETLELRYTDEDGLPIVAASIRLRVLPDSAHANGAVFPRAVVTGEDGIARALLEADQATAFLIEVDADEAAAPARVNVSVSKDSGGRIDVSVYQASAVSVTEAEVLLVDDLECANFDPGSPPAATDDGVNTKQTVPIEAGKAADVVFRGLIPEKGYTVAVVGRAGGQVVTRGCREGIFITPEMIDQKRAKSVSVDLADDVPSVVGTQMSMITKFKNSMGLSGIAGLLKTIAGASGGNGPADYVMGQIALQADRDDGLKQVLQIYRQPIAEALAGSDGRAQGSRLLQAAKALTRIENIRLHSRIDIRDEDDAGVITDELNIKHKMLKFNVDMLTNAGHMIKRDFSLTALADPNRRVNLRVFGGTAIKLEATAVMKVDDAAHVSVSPHQMSLPLADAILGEILFDTFGDYRLDRIVGGMLHCDRAGQLANDFAARMNLYDWELGDNFLLKLLEAAGKGAMHITIGGTVTTICQDEVKKILAEAQRRVHAELMAFRSDQYIVFEGSADMMMLNDRATIGWLKNGNWIGVGTFEAKRD